MEKYKNPVAKSHIKLPLDIYILLWNTTTMGKDNRVINIHVTEDQYQKLRLISYYSAKAISEIIREAIDKLPEKVGKSE